MGGGSTDTFIPYNAPGPGPGQSVNTSLGSQLDFSYPGMPNSFPGSSLSQAFQNIGTLYGDLGSTAPGYYGAASNLSGVADRAGINQLGNIYGTGVGTQGALGQQAQGQIAGLENQNLGQVQGLLDKYNQNYLQQLGPQGQLGQQMMGEFNNYGITPQSGAFQSALGNQLGSLGAQNALTLGQQALLPGIQAQYGTLGQTLQGQLGTAQQGTQQAGQLSNLGNLSQQNLLAEGALAPLNYANQATNMQSGIINQAGQLPIDYWGSQNNMNFAQNLANQNQSAQQNAAQMGLFGNLFGAGAGLAAAGK